MAEYSKWSICCNLTANLVTISNTAKYIRCVEKRCNWLRNIIAPFLWLLQNKLSRGVLRKRCSENMQQIYRRTPMPKCDLNSFNFTEITFQHGCSPVNLLHIFRTSFTLKTPEWLLLLLLCSMDRSLNRLWTI